MGSPAEDGRLARRALLVLGQAEVADHHAFVPIEQARPERRRLGDPAAAGPGDDQEVRGLHVPVDDAGFVQRSQPLRQRPDDRLEAVRVDAGTVRQPVVQRAAAGELHDQVRATVVELTDVVHRDHERAVDAAEELGLPHEAGPGVRVHGVAGIEDLDRGVTVERVVVGLDDRREPALAQHRPDVVATDPLGHPSDASVGCRSKQVSDVEAVGDLGVDDVVVAVPGRHAQRASSRPGSPPTWRPR